MIVGYKLIYISFFGCMLQREENEDGDNSTARVSHQVTDQWFIYYFTLTFLQLII